METMTFKGLAIFVDVVHGAVEVGLPSYQLSALRKSQGLLYFVSLCAVCLRQVLQNFENSSRPVVVFLFFVVE